MLVIEAPQRLPSNRGQVSITPHGTIVIQQGRPHGVMAQAGEVFLSVEDLAFITTLLTQWKAKGNVPAAPNAILPL